MSVPLMNLSKLTRSFKWYMEIVNVNLMVKPLQNVIFGRSVTQIFYQEICSSGGKQTIHTIHKVSAAFIVKSCHPQRSLILFHIGLLETFSPEGHPP